MDAVHARGLEIAYERAGTGPPLVLVHGALDDGRSWAPQLASLADEFTVIAWDEPGTGRSSDLPEEFGLEDYADCLATLIEGVGVVPAHVAGLSWGGTVVLELCRRRPDLVASVVLADTYAGWKGSLPEDEVRARVAAVRSDIATGALPAEVRPATIRRQVEVMAEADLTDVLPTIAVPTLLIWGELDERSALGVADQFLDAIPTADLVVIPDAGHCSNVDQPEAFNQAIREFLRELPGPS